MTYTKGKKKMKTMIKSMLVALIAVAASHAVAQESPWLVRARAVLLAADDNQQPPDSSSIG